MADIDKMASRPAEYVSQTGWNLIELGLIFVVWGAIVLIQEVLLKGAAAQMVAVWIGFGVGAALLWGAKSLRQRTTFPRGGYVVPRIQPSTRAIMFGGFIVITVLAFTLPGLLFGSRFVPPGYAICVAIPLLVEGARQRNWPKIWCGVYFAGLAALLWWMPGNNNIRWSTLQLASGLLMVVAGTATLRRFLKTNPIVAGLADE